MLYQFKCKEHGEFEVSQPMLSEHKANCPECNLPAQRIYLPHQHMWAGSVFRPNGSYRQHNDYAEVMKG
uniref:Putative regulatory protein FmdB zinc ribbon domain-containing protein n=1 Tax=viral metagenome TaxID=1070528 RepID=A0A6M3K6F2_9ZZZZ